MKKYVIALALSISVCDSFAQDPVSNPAKRGYRRSTLTLQQLKDSAMNHNIAMRSARHDIEAAEQQRKEAYTKYFPSVSGTALWFNANKGMAETSIIPSEVVPSNLAPALAQSLPPEVLAALANPVSVSMMKDGVIGSLTAVQPVYAGGQIVNGNKLARIGEDVSKLKLQLSENEVEKTTEQYYWQIVSLMEKMNTIDAVQTFLDDIHKNADVAVRAGVALRNDLLQVELRQNDVKSQRLKLQNGLSIVKMLLSQYCGLADTTFVVASIQPLSPDQPSSAALHSQEPSSFTNNPISISHLPEYQLLNKQVEATELQRKIAVGKNMPSVAVGAGYNYHNLLDKNHFFGMVFATVSIPVSDWWGGSHAIKRSKIEHLKAIEQLQDNSEKLMIRIQNARNNVEEAYQQLLIAQQSIKQAEENLRLNRNYYQAGTSKMSDLLEAQLLYQQACDRHTDAFADYQMKLLEYRQSTGM